MQAILSVGGGCATIRERTERVESPCTNVTEWVSLGNFCLALCSFGPPSRALVVITWRGVGCHYIMRLGQTVKMAQLLNIKVQVSSIWAKGCILMTVFVLPDLTWLPLLGGRKSCYIIIIIIIMLKCEANLPHVLQYVSYFHYLGLVRNKMD